MTKCTAHGNESCPNARCREDAIEQSAADMRWVLYEKLKPRTPDERVAFFRQAARLLESAEETERRANLDAFQQQLGESLLKQMRDAGWDIPAIAPVHSQPLHPALAAVAREVAAEINAPVPTAERPGLGYRFPVMLGMAPHQYPAANTCVHEDTERHPPLDGESAVQTWCARCQTYDAVETRFPKLRGNTLNGVKIGSVDICGRHLQRDCQDSECKW